MRGKPFEKGNKAGKGRPHGSRNKKSIFVEALEEFGVPIIKKGAFMAMNADRSLIRTYTERLVPVAKHPPTRFRLPQIEGAADIKTALNQILKQTAAGRLSPHEAEALGSFSESYMRTVGEIEHESRLAALEHDDSEETAA